MRPWLNKAWLFMAGVGALCSAWSMVFNISRRQWGWALVELGAAIINAGNTALAARALAGERR